MKVYKNVKYILDTHKYTSRYIVETKTMVIFIDETQGYKHLPFDELVTVMVKIAKLNESDDLFALIKKINKDNSIVLPMGWDDCVTFVCNKDNLQILSSDDHDDYHEEINLFEGF